MELKTKPEVVVIGELNVDIILNQIESFPEMGKEKLAQEMNIARELVSYFCRQPEYLRDKSCIYRENREGQFCFRSTR